MSDMQISVKLEDLSNETLIECFEYFHTLDLLYSFGRLNNRFEQLIRTLPLRVDFEDVRRETYDAFCRDLLINPDVQQRVCSLRISDRDRPWLIDDFFSKFSIDQFSHLRSLTFLDLSNNSKKIFKEILPKLSQITALHLLESDIYDLRFVKRTILIKSLTLTSLSLNEISRLFQYTPLLRYFKVSIISEEIIKDEYHQSYHPPHLKQLILDSFKPTFDDLTHFLRNMSNLRSLTICSSKDLSMVDASRWEQLIAVSLPYLKHFRFSLACILWWGQDNARTIFDRFQTDFWLKEHQWHAAYLLSTHYMMIYTVPYINESIDIRFESERYCNPLIDKSQTFTHVKKLYASSQDVLKHRKYRFPNLTSLVVEQQRNSSMKHNEEMIESSMNFTNFLNLKHLELRFDCRIQTSSILFQILDLSPQLYSLRVKPCFFELLLQNQPEPSRYLNGKIRKLDFSVYHDDRHCDRHVQIASLYQLVPNLEQLTMPFISIDDSFFLLD